jgi:hypothetical protein
MTYESRRNRARLIALQAQKPKSRGASVVAAALVATGVLSLAWAVKAQRPDVSAAPDTEAQANAVSQHGQSAWAEATFSPFVASSGPLPATGSAAEGYVDRRGAPDMADSAAIAPESALGESLASPQEDVRRDGLQWALGAGVDVSQDTLQDLLANDSSDDVRKLALQGLTERPEATREEIRAILDAAVTNPSAAVRADAARMIERMNELEQMDQRAREFRSNARANSVGPL